jgi:hypothetical protein
MLAAAELGLDLPSLDLPSDEARDLYGADLALVRPDQIVAWRGNAISNAPALLDQVLGRVDRNVARRRAV